MNEDVIKALLGAEYKHAKLNEPYTITEITSYQQVTLTKNAGGLRIEMPLYVIRQQVLSNMASVTKHPNYQTNEYEVALIGVSFYDARIKDYVYILKKRDENNGKPD